MTFALRFSLCFAVLASLSGCASLPQICTPPAEPMVTAELLFGRKINDVVGVSEAAFADFTAREITPRFPDGLTVIDARGQYRDIARARLIREPGKLVLITFRDDAQKRADVAAIADAYKTRFRQQSVLVTTRSVCASF